ncbi:retrovirus-related pol polyprotein from transposon TNT 1-94, partial [Tanacetum coccineum]
EMNQFLEMKGIKKEFIVARTPQQNRVAKRKNRTLIEAARTMLADLKLPITFWAEAEDDAKKAKLKLCLMIALNDDKAINIEPLATKSPIVDWETQILGEELFYDQIKRADESSKVYKVLYSMLNDFDRQDLIDLYRLVKDRFKTTQPEGYDRLLWGDLMTIFEPIILPGRIFILYERDVFLHLSVDESLGVIAVVGDTVVVNSLEIVLSEDKSFLGDLVGVGIGVCIFSFLVSILLVATSS